MSSPEQMRAAVAQYVAEIHRAYLAQAMTFPPGVRGQLPLLAPGRLTVAAAGPGTCTSSPLASRSARSPDRRSSRPTRSVRWSGRCASLTRWCCRRSR